MIKSLSPYISEQLVDGPSDTSAVPGLVIDACRIASSNSRLSRPKLTPIKARVFGLLYLVGNGLHLLWLSTRNGNFSGSIPLAAQRSAEAIVRLPERGAV